MSQVDQLREERDELIDEVEREREKVRELEEAQEIALKEMELLQSQIRSLPQVRAIIHVHVHVYRNSYGSHVSCNLFSIILKPVLFLVDWFCVHVCLAIS